MKTLITISLFTILLLLSACQLNEDPNANYKELLSRVPNKTSRYIVKVRVDGCEYVVIRRLGSVSITHAGNCDNHPDEATVQFYNDFVNAAERTMINSWQYKHHRLDSVGRWQGRNDNTKWKPL